MIFLAALMKVDVTAGDFINSRQLLKSSSTTEDWFRKVERALRSSESQPQRVSLVNFLKPSSHGGSVIRGFQLKFSSVMLEKTAKIKR